MTDRKSDIVQAQIDAVRDADRLADTPFSRLFHEARTTPRDAIRSNGYSGVTVQVRVRDGEIETSDPVKLRQGEHLRGTDAWDGMVSLPVKPFMGSRTGRQQILEGLRHLKQMYLNREEYERERQQYKECRP